MGILSSFGIPSLPKFLDSQFSCKVSMFNEMHGPYMYCHIRQALIYRHHRGETHVILCVALFIDNQKQSNFD
jgi:hypothetical protein